MRTLVIQIGNTDNKLKQHEWSMFVMDIDSTLDKIGYHIHFRGFSNCDSPYQNACWVCDDSANPNHYDLLTENLSHFRDKYRQHAIAVTRGTTEFY